MSATPTLPASPASSRPPRTLRARWRWHAILGALALVVLVVGSASLIMLLEQRQAVVRLHELAAHQVSAAAQQAMAYTQQALMQTAMTPADDLTSADLDHLLDTHPALLAISVVDGNGDALAHVAAQGAPSVPDWPTDPAWIAAMEGDLFTGLSEGDSPVLMLAVPLADRAGALIAQADTRRLWQDAVSVALGEAGYVVLADRQGAILAIPPDISPARQPADYATFQAALDGDSIIRLYTGTEDRWVVGRAEAIPNAGIMVITETPLSEFAPPLVRGLALWIMALALAAAVGEWLTRRVLRTVITPLDLLRQGARAVGGGDYGYRVRMPPQTDRELGDLGRAFNEMIERLQASEQQIEAYTHEMEEIVELRARELSRKAMQLEVAAEVSSKIATLLDPRTLVDEVGQLIQARFKVYHVEILLVDSDKGMIAPAKSHRPTTTEPIPVQEVNTSVIAWVARHGETLLVPDVNQEPRYRRSSGLPASQSELAIPLKFGGQVIGVLNLEADHRAAFPKDEIAVLESLANEIAVSLHNAQVFQALENANRDLAQATLQANQANTLKSRFLLNASHKLRTPLNSIIGYSETLLSGMYGDLPDTAQDRQRRILENGRHLQALIEDMLDLSTIETGYMELKLVWIELRPLLDEVMNAARALHQTGYAAHKIVLRLVVEDGLPPVWADLDRLRYILINLMSNAVKFTESGEVIMSADCDDEFIYVRVRDTGPGINEDELSHLFEPFQHRRGSTTSSGKGTGLGLSVSRMLAMMHGGDLSVDSALHRGSTFTLQLPRRKENAPR